MFVGMKFLNRVFIFSNYGIGFLLFLLINGCKYEITKPTLGVRYIFSSEHQKDWTATSGHWRWEEDVLIGETTTEHPLNQSSFLIWGHEVEDFVLNISFRVSKNGNSGIYYRCESGPSGYDALLGYQADIDGGHHYTGIIYENFLDRHREVLVDRGAHVHILESDQIKTSSFQKKDHLLEFINESDWNEYEIIARGSTIIQKINGHVVSILEDNAEARQKKGLFGFQLHEGPPMKVEFKNAVYKNLKSPLQN